MFYGKHGTLVGFEQYLVPPSGTKYRDPKDTQGEPLRNTKRVFVTDQLVDQLLSTQLDDVKFDQLCKNEHPQSIEVINPAARFRDMYNYRSMQRYIALKPWYVRLFNWFIDLIVSLFVSRPEKAPLKKVNPLQVLHESDNIHIYQKDTGEIIVTERKPEINNLVFCGGGPKIFGHVGVWKALNEAKIQPKKFAGSSAGAMMALLCYIGYNADEIAEIFREFKQEHIVYFDVSVTGLADSHSLKTALDYTVAKKIREITQKYNVPYPKGEITLQP